MLKNHVILNGRLTKKPELRTTSNGNPVTDLRIAISGNKRPDGTEGQPVYVTVDVFGTKANVICQYCNKGDQLLIQGELRTANRTTADGRNFSELRVVLTEFEFGAKARGNQDTVAAPTQANPVGVQPAAVNPAPVYNGQPYAPAPAAAPVQNTPLFTPNQGYAPQPQAYQPQPAAPAPTENISMAEVFNPSAEPQPVNGPLDGYYPG